VLGARDLRATDGGAGALGRSQEAASAPVLARSTIRGRGGLIGRGVAGRRGLHATCITAQIAPPASGLRGSARIACSSAQIVSDSDGLRGFAGRGAPAWTCRSAHAGKTRSNPRAGHVPTRVRMRVAATAQGRILRSGLNRHRRLSFRQPLGVCAGITRSTYRSWCRCRWTRWDRTCGGWHLVLVAARAEGA